MQALTGVAEFSVSHLPEQRSSRVNHLQKHLIKLFVLIKTIRKWNLVSNFAGRNTFSTFFYVCINYRLIIFDTNVFH